jgi:hypothetical protein
MLGEEVAGLGEIGTRDRWCGMSLLGSKDRFEPLLEAIGHRRSSNSTTAAVQSEFCLRDFKSIGQRTVRRSEFEKEALLFNCGRSKTPKLHRRSDDTVSWVCERQ